MKLVAVIGELHQDLFYEVGIFRDLIDELTRVLSGVASDKVPRAQLRDLIKRVFLDSPKKIPGVSYTKRGGNGNNSASLLAAIGTPVKLITTIGSDAKWLKDELGEEAIQIDTVYEIPEPTPTSTIIVDPEVTKILVAPNLKEKMNFESFDVPPSAFDDVGIAFFTPMDHKYGDLFKTTRELPVLVAFTLETQKIRDLDSLRACVPFPADIMFANLDDAALVGGISGESSELGSEENPVEVVDPLFREFAGVRVYTWGRRGSFVESSYFPSIHVPVVEVEVKDRTGAGDTFAAAFISRLNESGCQSRQFFERGPSAVRTAFEDAARFATRAAAYKISTTRPPSREDVESMV
ncbi:MAG: carbohydrate kinase family protein [Promethearchaeota archaeon]